MKIYVVALATAASLTTALCLRAQDASPLPTAPKSSPAEDLPTTSTVMRTNSMTVLDDKKRLGSNDHVSFRVVEDRDNDSQRLRVNDNGELEVPYIGLVPAQGRTCKELAYAIKAALEKFGHRKHIRAQVEGNEHPSQDEQDQTGQPLEVADG